MADVETSVDLCELYIPWVFGGQVDSWGTVVQAGGFRGKEWPCPGRAVGADLGITSTTTVNVTCSCRCHRGEFEHELPARADRTGVHPTDVLADG